MPEREVLDVDVLIVGAGPAGLAAAYHLQALLKKRNRTDLTIAVLEKGKEVGAHIISGAVMDWLRSLDSQSRTVRTFEKKRMNAKELLDSELGRPPTSAEVAQRMNISISRYEHLARLSQLGKEVHFSAMEPEADTRGRAAGRGWDMGDPKQVDPASKVSREFLTDYITRGLTREERLVLILYYYEELTMAEIGLVLDLSESRVSQIHKEILQRLRHRFGTSLCEELVA